MDAKSVVIGYALGYNDGLGGGSGGGDDWQPPEFPEPLDNQITMFVDITEERVGLPALVFALSNKKSNWTYGTGAETVDWGDGNIDSSKNDYSACFTHCYSKAGQYAVTVNLTPNGGDYSTLYGSDCIGFLTRTYSSAETIILSGGYNAEDFVNYTISPYQNALRAIKIGKSVGLTVRLSNAAYGVTYIKYCGEPYDYYSNVNGNSISFAGCQGLVKMDFDISPYDNTFENAPFNRTSLQKADFLKNAKSLNSYIFSGAQCIGSADLSNLERLEGGGTLFLSNNAVTELYLPKLTRENGTFRIAQNCPALRKVYAPNITSIEQNDFQGCYALQELVLAENCNLNGNTFDTCYSLYPKPKN